MATVYNQNPVINLSRGLVTEQTSLTPVEFSTIDELNCDILNDGTRANRKGLAYEYSDQTATNAGTGLLDGKAVRTFVWENVGDIAKLNLLVVQTEDTLHFFTLDDPQADQKLSSTIDMGSNYKIEGVTSDVEACSFCSIKGMLVVCGPTIDPFVVNPTIVSDASAPYYSVSSLNHSRIELKERDFLLIGESNSDYNVSIDYTTQYTRVYDTYNTGWTLTSYNDFNTGYNADNATDGLPKLTKRWYQSLNANGDFNYSEFKKDYDWQNVVSSGNFIIEIHDSSERTDTYDDRETVLIDFIGYDLQPDLPITVPPLDAGEIFRKEDVLFSRLKVCETYAGRVFYSGITYGPKSNKVYFTQIVKQEEDLGKCYQRNSPVDQFFNDLLPNDGGFIEIDGMSECVELKAVDDSLLVFARNGVWAIRPRNQEGFTATAYFVQKISDEGTIARDSVVSVGVSCFYLNKNGVHSVVKDQNNNFISQNISRPVIKSYYDSNYAAYTSDSRGIYDEIDKRVYWMLNPVTTGTQVSNKILVFDLENGAFLPWEVLSDTTDDAPDQGSVLDIYYYPATEYNSQTSFEDLFTGIHTNTNTPRLKVVVSHGSTGADYFGFAEFRDERHTDSIDGGQDFVSYLETPPDFFGDLYNEKESPDIMVYMVRDNVGYWERVSGDGGTLLRDIGLTMKHSWDFADFNATGVSVFKDETATTAYSSGTTTDWVFNTDHSTKNISVAGMGRALKLRFDNVADKNWKLVGYAVVVNANGEFIFAKR